MVLGGRYGLEHPDFEAVHAANELWYTFGADPDRRKDVAWLYPQIIELLDATESYIQSASSLKGLEFLWQKVAAAIESHPKSPVLKQQALLIVDMTREKWGLRCKWAPFCLLHTLSHAHCERHLTLEGPRRIPPDWTDSNPMTQPIFTSGLQNPNTGHYVGDFGSTPDGQHYIVRADDSLVISFTDAPLEGFTVPVDGSLETAKAHFKAFKQRIEPIVDHYLDQGMVRSRQLRKVSLDRKIEWLYYDLKNPKASWSTKAEMFNTELDEERQRFSSTPGPFKAGDIAQHVNGSRKLLNIDPPPGRPNKFG